MRSYINFEIAVKSTFCSVNMDLIKKIVLRGSNRAYFYFFSMTNSPSWIH
jgi:hypothetical protein